MNSLVSLDEASNSWQLLYKADIRARIRGKEVEVFGELGMHLKVPQKVRVVTNTADRFYIPINQEPDLFQTEQLHGLQAAGTLPVCFPAGSSSCAILSMSVDEY